MPTFCHPRFFLLTGLVLSLLSMGGCNRPNQAIVAFLLMAMALYRMALSLRPQPISCSTRSPPPRAADLPGCFLAGIFSPLP